MAESIAQLRGKLQLCAGHAVRAQFRHRCRGRSLVSFRQGAGQRRHGSCQRSGGCPAG